MRARVGLGIALLGALLVLLGVALMVVLGPDGRFTTGPHTVETDGVAVVTAPKIMSWSGVQMTVLAEVPVDKPIFVGLGNAVDVGNYIGNTQRLEVDAFHTPWNVKTRPVKGRANLPASPTALDWWLANDAGLGGASIDTTLPDETVSLAILSVGFSNLKGLKVTVAYGIKGGFAMGSGLALLGVGGILFGRILRRNGEMWRDGDVDEVVYVVVDEDGVEHEISAAEAAALEVEEVTVENYVVDRDGDEVGELPEPEPEPEPELEREPEPAPETEPAAETPAARAPVVYVFVDEDGVEHEVGEDELHEYEVVDDEGEKRP